ncbi:MAG: hypothetical protein IKJ00_07635, partial [Clostridia bacterium]|nr:hypothetical protein [Clostridia bacterium]
TISDSTDLHKNGCFIRLMRNGSTKYISGTIQVTNYDADGVAVTYGENTYRETTVSDIASSSNVQAVKLGIMVDSTLANGTLISIYANDVFVESFYMEGNAYDATSNTSIALWAENTTLKLDNITLKTYTAPIAA